MVNVWYIISFYIGKIYGWLLIIDPTDSPVQSGKLYVIYSSMALYNANNIFLHLYSVTFIPSHQSFSTNPTLVFCNYNQQHLFCHIKCFFTTKTLIFLQLYSVTLILSHNCFLRFHSFTWNWWSFQCGRVSSFLHIQYRNDLVIRKESVRKEF